MVHFWVLEGDFSLIQMVLRAGVFNVKTENHHIFSSLWSVLACSFCKELEFLVS